MIDNDKLIRWSLKEILTQDGYEVETFATADDALNQVTDNPYDLIFADLEINEKECLDMLDKISKIQPSAQIVILSAYSKHQIEPILQTLNIFSIIEKPFQTKQIREIAKEALGLQS